MLIAYTGLRTLLVSANVNSGQHIYAGYAPAGIAYPFVVINFIASVPDDTTSTDMLSERYQIKAVSDDQSEALSLQSAIYSAVHYAAPSLISGWELLETRLLLDIFYLEFINESPVFHAGADYRIRSYNLTAHT